MHKKENPVVKQVCCFIVALLVAASVAAAGEVGVAYVKTLGQTTQDSQPILTAGGRLAIDPQGNIYCGTPGGGSNLHKIAPDGRVVWSRFLNVPGFQATTLHGDTLYTTGGGYYGARQVQQWQAASGNAIDGWQHNWPDRTASINGVRPIIEPVAILADDNHLYIADRAGHELRRLDRNTGAEAPFAKRVMVVNPVDLAWGESGNLLILTAESVLETDTQGNPLRVPLIDGLSGAVAMDFDPRNRLLYIALGGAANKPLNLIRQYHADGKPTGKDFGIGGDYQGKWSPLNFAFSGGTGDILIDHHGGLWVNPGWDTKLPTLPTIVHLDTQGKVDRVIQSTLGQGITLDDQLNVYLGGQYKLTWDNQLLWTSGLTTSGHHATKPGAYPATLPTWHTHPAWLKGKLYIVNIASRHVMALDPATGVLTLPPVALPDAAGLLSPQASNDALLVGDAKGSLWALDPSLTAKPAKVFQTPEGWNVSAIFAAPDMQTFFVTHQVSNKGKVAALNAKGETQWEADGRAPLVLHGKLLITGRQPTGVQILDAATGQLLANIDEIETEGRTPLQNVNAAAVGSLDGVTYLFVLSQGHIRVYRLRVQP